jgi:hypothetical protein
MKLVLSILAFTMLSHITMAQFRFGGEAGINLANTTHDISQTGKDVGRNQPGIKAGLIVEYGYREILTVQTGLYYSMKGFRNIHFYGSLGSPDGYYVWQTRIGYVEIPVNLFIQINHKYYFGPGVYYSLALAGKGKFKVVGEHDSPEPFERELTFDNPQSPEMIGFKKQDYGAQFSAGYKITNRFFTQLQFSKGLNDIMPDIPFSEKIQTYKNWVFSATAGWYFH